jgi:hypothetical protein
MNARLSETGPNASDRLSLDYSPFRDDGAVATRLYSALPMQVCVHVCMPSLNV